MEGERIPAEKDDPFFYYPEPDGQGQPGKEADIDFCRSITEKIDLFRFGCPCFREEAEIDVGDRPGPATGHGSEQDNSDNAVFCAQFVRDLPNMGVAGNLYKLFFKLLTPP